MACNATIIQVYAPTPSYDDNGAYSYTKLQSLINQTPNQYFPVIQENWNAKLGSACEDWGAVCGSPFNPVIYDRGVELPALASYNILVLINTLGYNKPYRRGT